MNAHSLCCLCTVLCFAITCVSCNHFYPDQWHLQSSYFSLNRSSIYPKDYYIRGISDMSATLSLTNYVVATVGYIGSGGTDGSTWSGFLSIFDSQMLKQGDVQFPLTIHNQYAHANQPGICVALTNGGVSFLAWFQWQGCHIGDQKQNDNPNPGMQIAQGTVFRADTHDLTSWVPVSAPSFNKTGAALVSRFQCTINADYGCLWFATHTGNKKYVASSTDGGNTWNDLTLPKEFDATDCTQFVTLQNYDTGIIFWCYLWAWPNVGKVVAVDWNAMTGTLTAIPITAGMCQLDKNASPPPKIAFWKRKDGWYMVCGTDLVSFDSKWTDRNILATAQDGIANTPNQPRLCCVPGNGPGGEQCYLSAGYQSRSVPPTHKNGPWAFDWTTHTLLAQQGSKWADVSKAMDTNAFISTVNFKIQQIGLLCMPQTVVFSFGVTNNYGKAPYFRWLTDSNGQGNPYATSLPVVVKSQKGNQDGAWQVLDAYGNLQTLNGGVWTHNNVWSPPKYGYGMWWGVTPMLANASSNAIAGWWLPNGDFVANDDSRFLQGGSLPPPQAKDPTMVYPIAAAPNGLIATIYPDASHTPTRHTVWWYNQADSTWTKGTDTFNDCLQDDEVVTTAAGGNDWVAFGGPNCWMAYSKETGWQGGSLKASKKATVKLISGRHGKELIILVVGKEIQVRDPKQNWKQTVSITAKKSNKPVFNPISVSFEPAIDRYLIVLQNPWEYNYPHDTMYGVKQPPVLLISREISDSAKPHKLYLPTWNQTSTNFDNNPKFVRVWINEGATPTMLVAYSDGYDGYQWWHGVDNMVAYYTTEVSYKHMKGYDKVCGINDYDCTPGGWILAIVIVVVLGAAVTVAAGIIAFMKNQKRRRRDALASGGAVTEASPLTQKKALDTDNGL